MVDDVIFFPNKKKKANDLKTGDPVFLVCKHCMSKISGFDILAEVSKDGSYVIKHLICLSEKCDGYREITVIDGIVK